MVFSTKLRFCKNDGALVVERVASWDFTHRAGGCSRVGSDPHKFLPVATTVCICSAVSVVAGPLLGFLGFNTQPLPPPYPGSPWRFPWQQHAWEGPASGEKPIFFFLCKKPKLSRSHRQGKLGQALPRGTGPETKDSRGVSAGSELGNLESNTRRVLRTCYDQTPLNVLCLY